MWYGITHSSSLKFCHSCVLGAEKVFRLEYFRVVLFNSKNIAFYVESKPRKTKPLLLILSLPMANTVKAPFSLISRALDLAPPVIPSPSVINIITRWLSLRVTGTTFPLTNSKARSTELIPLVQVTLSRTLTALSSVSTILSPKLNSSFASVLNVTSATRVPPALLNKKGRKLFC